MADEAGNVVGQVASITEAGEPEIGTTNAPPSPSVAVRFCTATEEILRLTQPEFRAYANASQTNMPVARPKLNSPH